MKKKLLLSILSVGAVLSLASCSGPAQVEYVDAEGSKVTTEIKPTDDKEEVVKAVAALAQAGQANLEEVTSIGGNAKVNCDLTVDYAGMLSSSLKGSASADFQIGYEKKEDSLNVATYAKADANFTLKSSMDAAAASKYGVTGNINKEVKISEKTEVFYDSTEPKIYMSLNDSKGFIDVADVFENVKLPEIPGIDLPEGDVDDVDFEELQAKLLEVLSGNNSINVTISATTRDTVEFTITAKSDNAQNRYSSALAGLTVKVTVSTKYFIPTRVYVELDASAATKADESTTAPIFALPTAKASGKLTVEVNLSVNKPVTKLADSKKADYATDITSEIQKELAALKAKIAGISGSL